jgi:Leucine-rich repeat (LRR) protein
LTLYYNQITSIESGVFDLLTGLNALELNNNQLSSLPENLTGLTSLSDGFLSIDNNKLCT